MEIASVNKSHRQVIVRANENVFNNAMLFFCFLFLFLNSWSLTWCWCEWTDVLITINLKIQKDFRLHCRRKENFLIFQIETSFFVSFRFVSFFFLLSPRLHERTNEQTSERTNEQTLSMHDTSEYAIALNVLSSSPLSLTQWTQFAWMN